MSAPDTDSEEVQAGPSTPSRRTPSPTSSLSKIDATTPHDAGKTSTPAGVTQYQDARAQHQHLVTPAVQEYPDTPLAPAPNPAAKDLPLETPISSKTPTSGPKANNNNIHTDVDVSQFDPFATQSQSTTPRQPSASTSSRIPAPATPSTPPPRGSATLFGGSGSVPVTPATPGSTQSTSEPSFNFSGFLKDLRTKPAEPVARYLKSFLSNFAKKTFTVNEQVKLIHDFLSFISDKMGRCEPWQSQSTAHFENAIEAMEKLVMNRLYTYTFTPQLSTAGPITTDDLERDEVFAQRVRLFSWVREKHLDVPDGEASVGFLGFAEQELLKINHYKAPRDKMICILNCCKVIFGLIRHTNGAESTSADAFIPILIFVVLRANPEHVWSNIEYINRFRRPEKLQGEGGYYLSSLTGAIQFIESMDASSLSNITQEEFEANVENAIQDFVPSPTSERARRPTPSEMSPFAPSTPGEEAARPLALPSVDNARRFFQRTGSQVQEAVSRPLNAIGKIFDPTQQEDDGEGPYASSSNNTLQTPRRDARERRPGTPDSPWARFAAMGLTDSQPASGADTPTRDVPIPDFSSDQLQSTLDMSQEVYEQTRHANIQTLRQMFPALDEDVVEAILDACSDDLGAAIDRMLEM
ncbi:hypothetical protein BD324DRAFT_649795 [Kockovaella imperatae]|uniref:Guanine nucleotide exchange factor Vps9 n=1 Tax=Kockovaella imperatae TaxID=4999 RepID=A0A1Y1ULR9_9TREE|nr:hypothetical protein BD324DRAFT_649795 [Kockovaella imperatae]ORX38426.1 hypothetical protein BD324DRAFT_649795 [Kockovaella imperatae]